MYRDRGILHTPRCHFGKIIHWILENGWDLSDKTMISSTLMTSVFMFIYLFVKAFVHFVAAINVLPKTTQWKLLT